MQLYLIIPLCVGSSAIFQCHDIENENDERVILVNLFQKSLKDSIKKTSIKNIIMSIFKRTIFEILMIIMK